MPFIHKLADGFLKCKLCGYSQDGLFAVKRHIFSTHLKYKPYKCKYCDFAAVEPNKTERHLVNCHPEMEPRIVRLRFKGTLPEVPEEIPKTIYTENDESVALTVTEPSDVKPVFAEDWKPGDPFPGYGGEEPTSHSTPTTSFPNLTQADDITAEAMKAYEDMTTLSPSEENTHNIRIIPSHGDAATTNKKIFQCVYCRYSSKWGMKDVKMHIFSTHQKKYPFTCKYCSYGSRHQHLVKSHTTKSHPKKIRMIRYMMAESERFFVSKVISNVIYVAINTADLPVQGPNSTISLPDFTNKSFGDPTQMTPPPPPLKRAPIHPTLTKNESSDEEMEVDIEKGGTIIFIQIRVFKLNRTILMTISLNCCSRG